MNEYADIVKALRMCAVPGNCSPKCPRAGIGEGCIRGLKTEAADAIAELVLKLDKANNSEVKTNNWIPVTERLPECEWGAEVGNIEWISCGMVFAGCFGRGGKYRDAYFRTWTDGTEGIDAKDADYWRRIQIPEPPEEKQ